MPRPGTSSPSGVQPGSLVVLRAFRSSASPSVRLRCWAEPQGRSTKSKQQDGTA